MKTLLKSLKELESAGRWDIDFHLPSDVINIFGKKILKRVDDVADVVSGKRDPTKEPDVPFRYVDISAIDVTIGSIVNPQDLEGAEAPSRARKVVRAFDVIVSTCRPTRGAIAVVQAALHNQIASTAFSVVRAHENVNPFYLHFALRLPSTLEQFRKWSTGSSYPAILDSDVRKTLIPVPEPEVQDNIATRVVEALLQRANAVRAADAVWNNVLAEINDSLSGKNEPRNEVFFQNNIPFDCCKIADVQELLKNLPETELDGVEKI